MPVSAFICGCAGPSLTPWERRFFREAQPWGLILFKRNVDNPAQLAELTASFREAVGRNAPVLIDQEGGRVQRLGPPHWPVYPSAASYLGMAGEVEAAARLVHLTAQLMASDLLAAGINVDCLPVLDVTYADSHRVIGDRAYGSDPAAIARLGRAAADGLLAAGVLPVMKHLPGHGRALADSHLELPVVDVSLAELEASDFAPFIANADLPIGMSAHVVYPALDPDHPGTTSAIVIQEIVRKRIGFDGLLLSDDLSMQALSGTLRDRAEAAFKAGIDIVLHCNGNPDEMQEVAGVTPPLQGRALERAAAALARLRPPVADFDPVDARTRLNSALAMAV
ncbi:MAG: beta-N-acetylhexosaminidase [Methylobacteriaceae bacterium]|nr:beta-N-acetylhexosaminidase [Methylobacteriaceae bacterium]